MNYQHTKNEIPQNEITKQLGNGVTAQETRL